MKTWMKIHGLSLYVPLRNADMTPKSIPRWGILHRKENKLDGKKSWLRCDRTCMPEMFQTREEAREFISVNLKSTYSRPELKIEPHGWKMPIPVKIEIIVV